MNKTAKWEDVEALARRIVIAKGLDPDLMIIPPHLLLRKEATPEGLACVVSGVQFQALWQSYAALARALLETDIVTP